MGELLVHFSMGSLLIMFHNAWLPFFYFNGFQTHLFTNETIHYDAVMVKGSFSLVH